VLIDDKQMGPNMTGHLLVLAYFCRY